MHGTRIKNKATERFQQWLPTLFLFPWCGPLGFGTAHPKSPAGKEWDECQEQHPIQKPTRSQTDEKTCSLCISSHAATA